MTKARGHQNPLFRLRSRTAGFWGAIVGSKNLATPAHFILSPRPTPRKKKCPRTNEESPNCQAAALRTILSSANWDYRREERHAIKGRLTEHPKEKDCPQPTEIIEGKSSMPSKAGSQSIPRKRTSTMGQPWEPGGGAIQGGTVTFILNTHN